MKKVALVLLLVVGVALFASAQQQQTDLYVQTLYIEKVFATTLGYRIDYRLQSSLLLGTSYLPLDWFGGPNSVGKLVYADDNSVPFINIFWEDGEISYFVLYVSRNISDLSWGTLESNQALQERFNVDEPVFRF